MSEISKGRIERLGVRAVQAEADKLEYCLRPNIPENEKGISFDGEIEVFKDESETVQGLIGSVPVQVKTTMVEKFSTRNRTFPIELDHIRNYYDKNGVLLFLVEAIDDVNKKIFYKQLLAKELSLIIKKYGHQETRSIELRPLSETNLRTVCEKFINERKKQPAVLVESKAFKDSDFTSYEISSLTFNPNVHSTSDFFDHFFTVYGVKDDFKFPLHHMKFGALKTIVKECIVVDEKEYNFNIEYTYESDRYVLNIEDVLILDIKDNKKQNNLSFKVYEFKSLHIQLKIIPFLIELLNSKIVRFKETTFNFTNIKGQESYIEGLQKTYSILESLKEVFLHIGVDEKEVIRHKNGYHKLLRDIVALTKAVLSNDTGAITMEGENLPQFVKVALGDIDIILLYKPFSERKFINAFSEEALDSSVYFEVENKTFEQSPYVLLNNEFADTANVEFEVIKRSFSGFNPLEDYLFTINNNFCLQCLNHYDKSLNKQLLELVEYIYEQGEPTFPDDLEIYTINKLQTRFRKQGILKDEDYELLIMLKDNSEGNLDLKFCANVLLENKAEAKSCFKKFDKKQQKSYEQYPIFNLYKKMLED
ncbi:hypothetical protein COE08_21475 [Priestia megaterium]|uniref:DUF4365 domain-containing protein n=1 Tax=Priestia megaterium TaxID=1404 RepID=UPI000BFDFFFD|nr:DUF4365 domain-containing protein [Priestia megaterium]PGX17453.1 hypothetical protein COE08_21475 [Priestia megaterium]